mmetsp:Transcript_6782/g.16649  ORF Transcript_6782/g.16649 Transcript_6782/m.16649 type:complete len:216 (+) Transcript_6782:936-1583(+)
MPDHPVRVHRRGRLRDRRPRRELRIDRLEARAGGPHRQPDGARSPGFPPAGGRPVPLRKRPERDDEPRRRGAGLDAGPAREPEADRPGLSGGLDLPDAGGKAPQAAPQAGRHRRDEGPGPGGHRDLRGRRRRRRRNAGGDRDQRHVQPHPQEADRHGVRRQRSGQGRDRSEAQDPRQDATGDRHQDALRPAAVLQGAGVRKKKRFFRNPKRKTRE